MADSSENSQTPESRRNLTAQVAKPLRQYIATETGSAGLLLLAAVIALVWANSPVSDSYTSLWDTVLSISLGSWHITESLQTWIDEGLMALFFFVIGLEVRRELSIGELTERRRITVPIIAGIAGMAFPAALYLLVNGGTDAAGGWGIVIATDTAFLLGALAIVGPGCSTQLRIFLLTLSIVDDILAITVIGTVYAEAIHIVPLVIMFAGLVLFSQLPRMGIWRNGAYLGVGLVIWVAALESGVHPTLAGMIAGLMVAAYDPDRRKVEQVARSAHAFRQSPLPDVARTTQISVGKAISANERLQTLLLPLTGYVIVPLFALANTGVDLRGGTMSAALTSPITWGIVLGLVVGKTLGIGGVALTALRLKVGELPRGVGNGQVVGGAALSGIGFTVSLLIAQLAFDDQKMQDEAKVGILIAAVLAVILGWVIFKLAAVFRGETSASLPMVLDMPVDPERDHIRGRIDAPYTLVEYGDFECPFCGRATGMVKELREKLGDDLRYVFRHLTLIDVHPHAELAAEAAEAASSQGKFWEMHDILFAHQGDLDIEDLISYAGKLDLDVDRFVDEVQAPASSKRVREDVASAEASGARGTPTFFIGDRRHVGAYDAKSIAAELRGERPVSTA